LIKIDEHLIFSGSGDKIIAQWNLKTFQDEKFELVIYRFILHILYIPEKQLYTAGTFRCNVHILDLEKKEEIKFLNKPTSQRLILGFY